MEFISGNIFIRTQEPMAKGAFVTGHAHNFSHTTYVNRGAFRISLLRHSNVDFAAKKLQAEIETSRVIRASDTENWALIEAGRFHLLESLEDGSVYHCIYSHQMSQMLNEKHPGSTEGGPTTITDEHGNIWLKVNPNIMQVSNKWSPAYL